MTVATSPTYTGPGQSIYEQHQTLIFCLLAIAAGLIVALVFSPAYVWPEAWVLPIKQWISDMFRWLDKTATFALFTVKEFTRAISWVLKQPLIWSEFLLWKGAKAHLMLPIIWMAIAAVAGIFVTRRYNGKIGLNVAIAILAVVSLDGLPFILASLSKAIKASPDTALLVMIWSAIFITLSALAIKNFKTPAKWTFLGLLIGFLVLDFLIGTAADAPIRLEIIGADVKARAVQDFGAFIGFSQWPADLLLAMGFKSIKAIPWVVVVAGFAIFAHWVGGWRLAIIVGLAMSYLAVTGLWRESMKTFSLVVVAVPFSAAIGLWLGVWVTRSKRAASVITPMFDLMQATPHLAYLVPVVVMFGAGQVPALIATVIFAMPPMARCTILAIQTVSSDVVESGRMSGCTPSQLLWKVQLPASQKTLLLGLNQVIMQTLAMVVIASLVGAQGLGHKLLFSLQQLKLGFATMQGIAIVLMAVVLDQLTQAYANRATDYEHRDNATFVQRHKHLLIFASVLVAAVIATFHIRGISILPKKYLLVDSKDALELDKSIKAVTFFLIDYIKPFRDFVTVNILIPIRNFYQAMPWSVVMALIAVGAHRLGGWKLVGVTCGMFFFIIVFPGNWQFATTTFYYVSSALVVCMMIGVPLGIWAARSPIVARITLAICDTLQTFPSFIYLLPAIMLFKVGELAIIFAIVPYATVPAIRYTYLGLKRVPEVTIEAAKMAGATPLQRLWKVELPVAIPEIMLGVNQTIMMALAMTAITALIGGTDLGQEIYRALPTSDAGRGVMAGLGIATLGIIADRLIGAWADKRKKDLGIT
ncbi:MAG: ABC transporter permease subunit [Pseudomonadota bacterium]